MLQRLIAARDAAGARVNGCLRATMAVLMNLTHSNRPCAQLLAECGLGESAAALLGAICGPGDRGSGAVRQRVVASLEVVSLALGLLINLVEGAEKCKAQLLAWDGGVLELLANLVSSGSGNNTRCAAAVIRQLPASTNIQQHISPFCSPFLCSHTPHHRQER